MRTFTLTILALAAAMVSPVIGAPINSVQVPHTHSEHVPVGHQHPPSSNAVSESSDAVESRDFDKAHAARNMPDGGLEDQKFRFDKRGEELARREILSQELAEEMKCMSMKNSVQDVQECLENLQHKREELARRVDINQLLQEINERIKGWGS
ncbi:hypothetical protein DAEQUDRAFT_767901 [Daedalea quercina L-15889]|uniref:Uncharacterized protein n=1 Tax=Daedalea quercina L-15889 TaxID=1314783 RepID=A0A165N5N3_9APHY|nr:hypothetical protein DAEQUDRAFT_767901 [Daedalea quercina L-15889]